VTALAPPVTRPVPRFVGPSIRDARLHTAAVLVTIQVLGQTVLGFDLSIAQILVAIGTSALLEVCITLRRTRQVVWPASAMLTGNGVALILRVPGTIHGDWWSMRGWWIFAATAAVSLLSKYVIRVDGRHLFNPSNFGLVLVFLALGPLRAEPLDFWWGPRSPSVLFAAAVIVTGGFLILRRLRLLSIALTFWVTFAAALGVVSLAGHCITARWHVGPLCNLEYWTIIVTSPELLIFLCFMITDPRTVPIGRRGRTVYAVGVAVLAALLMATQTTEFGSKVALLGALTLVCAARPLIERLTTRAADAAPADPATTAVRSRRRPVVLVVGVAVAVGALVLAGAGTRPEPARAAVAADFPVIAADAVPGVRIATGRLSRQVDAADARAIAHDLLQDLAVQERALIERDVEVLPAFSDRAWRQHLEAEMQRAARARSVRLDRFEIRKLVVSVAMRRGQAAPAVLATVFGRRRELVYHDGRDGAVSAGDWRPLATTFEVLWDSRRYVVVSDELPEGWTPPRR